MCRVLTLCEYGSLNGGERSFLAAAERLVGDGFEFLVAAPDAGPLRIALQHAGLDHVPFACHDGSGARRPHSALRAELHRLISRTRPGLIHANSLSMSRLAGPVTRQSHRPAIGHLRDIIRVSRAAIGDLNSHTRLLAVSEATRTWYVSEGLDRHKTFVAHNGVDLHQFRPRAPSGYLHAELGIPVSAILIGSIGQIGPRKGTDLFVEAAKTVACQACADAHKEAEGVHFLVVGKRYSEKAESREFEARARCEASRPPLRGRLHFLGVRPDVAPLLNELTLLVHAARQEPLGRVLLESAAAGVAIVATDVGGTREIFPEDRQAAVLVAPDSPGDLAAAMLHLLAAPARRRELAQAARQRAQAAFDAEIAARRLAAHYRDVVANHHAGPHAQM
ncbi:MAG: glycosyltransferase family 4 protein [Planctomycetes bacterium]|nr:glycosyltransferase family 4 protein [Planctomycetota bacterium]